MIVLLAWPCPIMCACQADKRMDMVQWGAAYQNFALAAHAVGFWDWHLSMAHYTNCIKVACESLSHVLCELHLCLFLCRPG